MVLVLAMPHVAIATGVATNPGRFAKGDRTEVAVSGTPFWQARRIAARRNADTQLEVLRA